MLVLAAIPDIQYHKLRRAVEEGKRKPAGEVQVTIQASDLEAALEEVKQG